MESEFDKVIQKAQTSLYQYSDSDDISALTVCMLFIVILCLVLIGAVTIRYGFHNKYLIFILLIVGLFVNYRLKMGAATTLNLSKANYKSIDPMDKKSFAMGILGYLSTGIGIKITRIKGVRLFFILLVPLVMICSYEFFYGFMTTQRLLVSMLVIYPINYFVWTAYFSEEKSEFQLLQDEYDRNYREVVDL